MLDRSEVEASIVRLESLIESLEDLGYQHLLGADPAKADRTLTLEKALSKALRALHKARHDLDSLAEMCE